MRSLQAGRRAAEGREGDTLAMRSLQAGENYKGALQHPRRWSYRAPVVETMEQD